VDVSSGKELRTLVGQSGEVWSVSSARTVRRSLVVATKTIKLWDVSIGGLQRPLLIAPDRGGSFDIGRFTLDEQKQIPLAKVKPLILRPQMQNEKLRFDNLRLGSLLTQALRDRRACQRPRPGATARLCGCREMADAIVPSGLYTADGDTVKVTLVLVRNTSRSGKRSS